MAAPRVVRLPLVDSRRETPEVVTFFLEPPSGGFDYEAGQHVLVRLQGVDDERGSRRSFTLSSAPGDERLSITTKDTGSVFKRVLAARVGAEDAAVECRGPLGTFVLQRDRPALMIAGGIGITPFRSMIRAAVARGVERPIVLLYSNVSRDEIAFRDELDDLARHGDRLRVVHTITGEDDTWDGRRGRIDAELIRREASALDRPVHYVCGPPGMVEELTRLLRERPEIEDDDVRDEAFTGY